MSKDSDVCLCFHVSYRKIVNYVKVEKPKRASQISQCGGAGTGCGWCRPFLQRIFEQQIQSQNESQDESQHLLSSLPDTTSYSMKTPQNSHIASENDDFQAPNFDWNSDLYAKKRQNYLQQKRSQQ